MDSSGPALLYYLGKMNFPTDLWGDPVEVYLREVGQVPPLSPGEERVLRDRIASDANDDRAKKRLLEAHLMLVVEAARQYGTTDIHLLDLIQQGNMGLLDAVNQAWRSEDEPFAPFAEMYIHRALRTFLAMPRKKIIPPHLE